MDALFQLAEFVANLTFESLPAAVVDRARWVLRDTVGVIIGGMVEPEVSALARYAQKVAPGRSSLLGCGGRVRPEWAVLVHGTAGTSLEMDEGHAFARGHAAIHAVPPALALAQSRPVTGREMITAIVAGYEVAARAGIATQLRGTVHPFGAWGVLGAAAVSAWYQDFPAAAVAGTLELAASYALTPSFKTAYQGATVRNTYAGMVNQHGLFAADLYKLGFRGEKGGLQTTFGDILGQAFDPAALNEGLNEHFEIMRGYFKPYSGCRYTHAAIDAVLALCAEEAVAVDQLESVTIDTYDLAANLTDPSPKTSLAGRFSTPYVVAATLANGSAGPEIFTPQVLRDPQVLDLAGRVSVREEPAFTAMTPAKRPARVTLTFADGRQRQKTVYSSKGDPDQPMSAAELEAKFSRLCLPLLGADQTRQAGDALGRIEEWSDLDELMKLLTPRESPTLEINGPSHS